MPGAFDRRATQRGGMHRRPNVAVIVKRSTKQQQTDKQNGERNCPKKFGYAHTRAPSTKLTPSSAHRLTEPARVGDTSAPTISATAPARS